MKRRVASSSSSKSTKSKSTSTSTSRNQSSQPPPLLGLYSASPDNLAFDHTKVDGHTHLFNKCTKGRFPVTDQFRSGRCWIFAALNTVRLIATSSSQRLQAKNLEFSECFIYFYNKLECYRYAIKKYCELKERLQKNQNKVPKVQNAHFYLSFLRTECLNDGGTWQMVVNIIKKYGIVPKTVMPDSPHALNSSSMNALLYRILHEDFAFIDKTASVTQALLHKREERFVSFLCAFLGEPPTSFEYKFESLDGSIVTLKDLTPLKLLHETGFDPDDFVCVVNDPRNKYCTSYALAFLSNMVDGKTDSWLNMPSSRLVELTRHMIDSDIPVWFTCNFGPDIDSESGVMEVDMYNYKKAFNLDLSMNKAERMTQLDSIPNHAMIFTCYDKDDDVFKVENSHGPQKFQSGYLTMTRAWFNQYVFHIVVHKRFLNSKETRALTNIVTLPPWDSLGTVAKLL
jgi:bleomycin hydrolase